MLTKQLIELKLTYIILLTIIMIVGAFADDADSVNGEQWRGWRGLHHQGRIDSSKVPTQWSDSSNVLWHTEIRGNGHSSPVVSDSSVFVSSAWNVDETSVIQLILTGLIAAAALILVLLLFPFISTACSSKNKLSPPELISVLGFFILLGLLFHSFFFSYWLPSGYSASDSGIQLTLWFHSGLIVALCLILAVFYIPRNSKTRLYIALSAIVWGIFLLLARPYPDYYSLASRDIAVLTRMFLPFIIVSSFGLILLLIWIFTKQKSGSETVVENKPGKNLSPYRIFFMLGAFLLGLSGFFTFISLNLGKIFYMLLAQGRYTFPEELTTFSERLGFLFNLTYSYPWFLVITNVGIIIWFIVEISAINKVRLRPPEWFLKYIILLGLVNFITTNYLSPETRVERGIICLDSQSGNIKWQVSGLLGPPVNQTKLNSPATPTPLIDGERVYAYFGTPGLICADYDGNQLWTNTDLPFDGIHGIGASPVISGDHLIILSAMSVSPYLTALDRYTGKRVWTTNLEPWEGLHGRHRTPLITEYQGRDIIIDWGSSSKPAVSIFDVQTGEMLRSYPTEWRLEGEAVTSVLREGDVLYLSGKAGVHALSLSKIFQQVDPLIWERGLRNKGPNTASPVFHNDMLFMVSDLGMATCLDANTGELLWQEKLEYGQYYSSPVIVNGIVHFSNTRGITTLVACERVFNTRAKNILADGLFASPAIYDDHLFMRTYGRIWCLYDKGDFLSVIEN